MKKKPTRPTPTKSLWPQTFAICSAIIFAAGMQIVLAIPDADGLSEGIMAGVVSALIVAALIFGDD